MNSDSANYSGSGEQSSANSPYQGAQKRQGMGLTVKVIFLMLLVSLLPVSIYFGLSSQQAAKSLSEQTTMSGQLVTGLLAADVDEWVDKNVRALKAIARIPSIQYMEPSEQESVLKSLMNEYPWMYLVFTTDEDGMNIARSDGKALKDYSNRTYFKDVLLGADYAWQNLIGKTSKQPSLVLAVPIKRNGNIVGVLAAAMTREAISTLITSFQQGKTGSSFLVDQTGKAVAHRNSAFVLSQENMSNHPLVAASMDGKATQLEFVDNNGKKSIGFSKKTKLGWTLAIQQDRDEAYESLDKARNFAYMLLAATIVIILFIAYFSSRAIVKPIKKLTDAANRISTGDLDVEIEKSSKDEIGDLADAVMRMQDSLRLSISRLKRRR